MEKEALGWVYIFAIVDSFDDLILYFYTILHHHAPWLRQSAFALIFSIGLFLIGMNLVRAPFDRFKTVAITSGMVLLAGSLNMPTTNTKAFNGMEGKELTVGGYWSYLIGNSLSGVFRSSIDPIWDNYLGESLDGRAGLVSNSADIAWSNKAKEYADSHMKGIGKEAYVDYMIQCARPMDAQITNNKQRHLMRYVGAGSHMLGMTQEDGNLLAQVDAVVKDETASALDRAGAAYVNSLQAQQAGQLAKQFDRDRAAAMKLLEETFADSKNPIKGDVGYRIPSEALYAQEIKNDVPKPTDQSYEQASQLGTDFAAMLPPGSASVDPGSEQDYMFYPKTCLDLYKVANKTMENFRSSIKNLPEYKKMAHAGAFQSVSAAREVRKAMTDIVNDRLARNNIDTKVNASLFDDVTDMSADTFIGISNWINKIAISYKIPALVTAMALLVVILMITFPVFAVLSVVFGPRLLLSYAKFMAVPFLVIFINQFFILISTQIIAFNSMQESLANTFTPGSNVNASALSGQNIKAIVFSLLTVAELAIIKFLLFDDFRSVMSSNPSQAISNAVRTGASAAISAASVAALPAKSISSTAMKVRSRNTQKSSASSLRNISRDISKMAATQATGNYTFKPSNRAPAGSPPGRASNPGAASRDLSVPK